MWLEKERDSCHGPDKGQYICGIHELSLYMIKNSYGV